MSKKRGLSVDEKRAIVLDIFHESNAAWLLKDMEKAAAKKGVVLQTVKDIVMLLIGDDLVSSDKIGTSNYFWSLKSEHANKVRKKHAALSAELEAAEATHADLSEKVEAAKAARPDTEERGAAAAALAAAQARHAALKAEMQQYAANDPEVLKRIQEMKPIALEAANRWTDNAFLIKQWLQKTAGAAPETIAAFFKAQCDIDIDAYEYLTEEGVLAALNKGAKSGGGKKRKAAEE